MHIYNLIVQYWADIAIVACFIVVMAVLVKRGKKDLVKRIIYAVVVEAEKVLGSKTGAEKKAYVIAAIYQRLPFLLKLVFTQKDVEGFVEDGVYILKTALSSGEVNLLGYTEEQLLKIDPWTEPENLIK